MGRKDLDTAESDTTAGGMKLTEEDQDTELVKEAYFRSSEVMFLWWPDLNPWHRNAVAPLVHRNAIFDPAHPLRHPGQDTLVLYLGTFHTGHQAVLFSLHQVQYLQYYIHAHGLANPERVMQLAQGRRDEVKARGETIEGDFEVDLEQHKDVPEWVPLPKNMIRASEFKSINEIQIPDLRYLNKLSNEIKRHNARVEHGITAAPLIQSVENAVAAEIDNETPGPGFGPGKTGLSKGNRSRRVGKGDGEGRSDALPNEAEGAADFANLHKSQSETEEDPAVSKTTRQQISTPKEAAKPDDDLDVSSTVKNLLQHALDRVPSPENSPLNAGPSPPDITKAKGTPTNFTTDCFNHAQQAYLVAALGGLKNAGLPAPAERSPKTEDAAATDDDAGEEADGEDEPPIGRSLFVALDVTCWEGDEDVVLEVGWAAVWWQERLEAGLKGSERFEEIRDAGQFVVQDHLLERKNANRSSFRYGAALPVSQKELSSTVNKKIVDLHARAGGGPIYVVIHSADRDVSQLAKLGFDTSGWQKRLKPASWEWPSYGCVKGIGQTFVIDTAILFAAVENDETVLPAPLKTGKTLGEVTALVFGQKPEGCDGSAGNYAVCNLELFCELASGTPLEALRAGYRLNSLNTLLPVPDTPKTETVEVATGHGESTAGNGENLLVESSDATAVDEDEYDSESEMIKGVYIAGEDGDVPIDDGW